MEQDKKNFISHASIIGIFTTLVLILSIPLILYTIQEKQDNRQKAMFLQPASGLILPQQSNNTISGYVYLDRNQNGERDYAEQGKTAIQLKITLTADRQNQTPGFITTISTDDNGYFKYQFSNPSRGSLNFIIQLILPDGYNTTNNNPEILTITRNNPKELIEFGIYPISKLLNPPAISSTPEQPSNTNTANTYDN